jgi:hypothetical protein
LALTLPTSSGRLVNIEKQHIIQKHLEMPCIRAAFNTENHLIITYWYFCQPVNNKMGIIPLEESSLHSAVHGDT